MLHLFSGVALKKFSRSLAAHLGAATAVIAIGR
jgi:hypothetical protein